MMDDHKYKCRHTTTYYIGKVILNIWGNLLNSTWTIMIFELEGNLIKVDFVLYKVWSIKNTDFANKKYLLYIDMTIEDESNDVTEFI